MKVGLLKTAQKMLGRLNLSNENAKLQTWKIQHRRWWRWRRKLGWDQDRMRSVQRRRRKTLGGVDLGSDGFGAKCREAAARNEQQRAEHVEGVGEQTFYHCALYSLAPYPSCATSCDDVIFRACARSHDTSRHPPSCTPDTCRELVTVPSSEWRRVLAGNI